MNLQQYIGDLYTPDIDNNLHNHLIVVTICDIKKANVCPYNCLNSRKITLKTWNSQIYTISDSYTHELNNIQN